MPPAPTGSNPPTSPTIPRLLSAKLDERAIAATVDYAKQATRFDGLKLDPVTARKIKLLKLSLTIATPADPKESEELTRIVAGMEGTYGKGKYCPSGSRLAARTSRS